MSKKKKPTIQDVFDQTLAAYEAVEDKENWDSASSGVKYNAGRSFAYSHVLQMLYQLEEVEHEGNPT
jgi:hypothetical protein